MPTAAKLVAAVVFALVGGLAAHLFIPAMPEGTAISYFREISAGIGLLCGWWIMGRGTSRSVGRSTGHSYSDAISTGIVTSVAILFWCLLGFAIYFMIKRSTNMMYDGPMEAVLAVFELMYEYGAYLARPATPVALLLGGIFGGCLTEFVARRWS